MMFLFSACGVLNTDGDPSVASEDCDDSNGLVYPGAPEVCDGVDNDCDGMIDDQDSNVSSSVLYYYDGDGDEYGTFKGSGNVVAVCFLPPEGYVPDGGDCDDTDVAINPEAAELCDGVVNDCDEQVDENITFVAWYVDTDGDGYGEPSSDPRMECIRMQDGYSGAGVDCDDSDPGVNPYSIELCDQVDNNCDGIVDTDALDMST
jgi:hypothetical protein